MGFFLPATPLSSRFVPLGFHSWACGGGTRALGYLGAPTENSGIA